MLVYLLARLAILVGTLIVASIVVFGVIEVLPGNAAQTLLGASATPEAVAALAQRLGLDQPVAARYLHWIAGALSGDLGQSYAYQTPIAPLVASAFAVSAPLAALATTLATAIALIAGLYAASRRGRTGDAIVTGLSQFGMAAPSFWVAILLVLLFSVHWRLAPAGGFPGWLDPWRALGALVLPAIALALVQAAVLTRVVRSALIETLGEDFIRTARAKGLTRRAILWRHALPNALTPVLTILGLQFANLIGGAIVVENVFVLPGLGRLIFQAISNRDSLVVADCAMLLAIVVIGVNFLVDVACAAIDPRWREARS